MTFRMSLSNRRAIDDVADYKRLPRGEAIDVVIANTTVHDIAKAICQRYESTREVEAVNRSGIGAIVQEATIKGLDDLSIRTGLTRETVLRLAIEAFYVKFTVSKASQK